MTCEAKTLNASLTVRPATGEDAFAISDIYNYYVSRSTATFESSEQTVGERLLWLREHESERHPVLVAELPDGTICGWASTSRYRSHCAYNLTVEASWYVHHEHQRKGIGKALVKELLVQSQKAGHHCMVALMCGENESSVKLARDMGFEVAGTLKEVGRKFNRWLDVVIMQKILL